LLRSPLRRGLATLSSTLFACALGYGVASADPQSSTAVSPSAAPSQAPVVTAQAPVTKSPRSIRQTRFSWQITPMMTFFTNGNLNTSKNATTKAGAYYPATDYTRLGWQLGYDVAPRTTIYWNRTPNDSFQSMVNGARNAPSIDLIDEIGASFRLASNWTIGGEYYRRWRQCCPGTGDPANANPAWQDGWAVTTSYATGPSTIIGKPFSVSYVGTEFKHPFTNPAAIAGAAGATALAQAGTLNEGTKFTSQVTAVLRIPVYHQRKFVPFVNYQLLPTYFSNSVEPVYSNAVNYGVNIAPSQLVSYTFSIRNLNEHKQGYPFAFPNVQHYSWLIVAANFHGRL
jgi:hypothetical protein